jgi:hypothetical protein
MLIEYDGEQHFKPVKFHKSMTDGTAQQLFEQTQTYDNIKNQYANEHNIKLIRISYKERSEINSILDDLFLT